MRAARLISATLVIVLAAVACASSPEGFELLDGRDDLGVEAACVELADEYLLAAQAYLDVLGEMTFGQWVTEGLFHVEDTAPEVAAALPAATDAYAAAGCPAGYLSTVVLAHADLFDRVSAAATIFWAGIVVDAISDPEAGAADNAQAQEWFEFVAARDRDVSDRAVIPVLDDVAAITNCDDMAAATNDLFQQQLYLISSVPFLTSSSSAMAELREPTVAVQAMISNLDCWDVDLEEAFLREAHLFDLVGPGAAVTFALEIDEVFADHLLTRDYGLVTRATTVDAASSRVDLIVRNGGDVRMRVLSVEVDDERQHELPVDLMPGEGITLEITVPEISAEGLAVEIEVQRPIGTVVTESVRLPLN